MDKSSLDKHNNDLANDGNEDLVDEELLTEFESVSQIGGQDSSQFSLMDSTTTFQGLNTIGGQKILLELINNAKEEWKQEKKELKEANAKLTDENRELHAKISELFSTIVELQKDHFEKTPQEAKSFVGLTRIHVPTGIYAVMCAQTKWHLGIIPQRWPNDQQIVRVANSYEPHFFKLINHQGIVLLRSVANVCGASIDEKYLHQYKIKNDDSTKTYSELSFDVTTDHFAHTGEELQFEFFSAANTEENVENDERVRLNGSSSDQAQDGVYKVIIWKKMERAFVCFKTGGFLVAAESDPLRAAVFHLLPSKIFNQARQTRLPPGNYNIQLAGKMFVAFNDESKSFTINNPVGEQFQVIYNDDDAQTVSLYLPGRKCFIGRREWHVTLVSNESEKVCFLMRLGSEDFATKGFVTATLNAKGGSHVLHSGWQNELTFGVSTSSHLLQFKR